MKADYQIMITADDSIVSQIEEELLQLQRELPAQQFKLFLDKFKLLSEVISIDLDASPTDSTDNIRIQFKISDSFRELVAAFRAGNVN